MGVSNYMILLIKFNLWFSRALLNKAEGLTMSGKRAMIQT
jgi:hypothetical protein